MHLILEQSFDVLARKKGDDVPRQASNWVWHIYLIISVLFVYITLSPSNGQL